MRDLTSIQLSQQMSPAWNIGNSLDASTNETHWGNPLINQQLLNAVKAAGFKTVRIPVSWNQYADADGKPNFCSAHARYASADAPACAWKAGREQAASCCTPRKVGSTTRGAGRWSASGMATRSTAA